MEIEIKILIDVDQYYFDEGALIQDITIGFSELTGYEICDIDVDY